MNIHNALWAAQRSLSAAARITFPTGATVALDGDQVIGFSVDEGSDSPLLPGGVLSAECALTLADDEGQWRWGGSIRGERPLVGGTAQLYVVAQGEQIPCGTFVIRSVGAEEGRVRLSGSDSIASELAGRFEDVLSYPTDLNAVWAHLVGQTRYAWPGALPGGDAVIAKRPDWGDVTLRRAAGWIAQAVGCFVRVSREGALEVVPCAGGEAVALTPDDYFTFRDGFDTYGPVTGVRVGLPDGESVTVSDGDGETVSVEGNPLFAAADAQALAGGLLERVAGLTLTRGEVRWRGDPAVGVGAQIALTDPAGQTRTLTVTRQSLRFAGGFGAACACGTPEVGNGGMLRAITPEGGVNAGALTGAVDGGLLAVGSVTARAVAAGAITAEKLAAGAVSADALRAGSVTADKLDADSVSSRTAEFIAAQIGRLTAEDVETDALYAALAHVVQLAAGSVSAGRLEADRLAAALAQIVSLRVAAGEFDFAAVQSLVSGALALEQGAMDSVYVKNLAVTGANLLSATLGKLVLRGDDGGYYRVFVGATGEIRAEETAVSAEEIAAGQAQDGREIVETSVNVASLNASELQAASAVVNELLTAALTAQKITAADALIASATVPALYVTAIDAIGGSIDISANESIRLVAGRAEEAAVQWSDEPPQRPTPDKLWGDEGVHPPVLRRWALGAREPLRTLEENPAVFDAAAGERIGAEAGFEPRQSGSGERSLSNPWTIAGQSALTLTVNGDDVVCDFGETVFGAQVDFARGQWTQTWRLAVIDDFSGLREADGGWYLSGDAFADMVRAEDYAGNLICDALPTASARQSVDGASFAPGVSGGAPGDSGPNRLYVNDGASATLEALKASLAGRTLRVAYRLAQPVTCDFPAGWLPAIAGANSVSADGDSLAVRCGLPVDRTFSAMIRGNPCAVADGGRAAEASAVIRMAPTRTGTPSVDSPARLTARSRVSLTVGDQAYTEVFQRPVYGGTLDWMRGGLTEDWSGVVLNGAEEWSAAGAGGVFCTPLPGLAQCADFRGQLLCDRLETLPGPGDLSADGATGVSGGEGLLYLRNGASETADALKAWLGEHPVQAAYRLAQPVRTAVAPLSFSLPAGECALSTDGDGLSVHYKCSGWETVNDVTGLREDVAGARQSASDAQSAADRAAAGADRAAGLADAALAGAAESARQAGIARSEIEQLADRISLAVTRGELETCLTLLTEGVRIGRSDSAYSVLVANAGLFIRRYGDVIASFVKRQLTSPSVRIANPADGGARCVMRTAADGGMMIVSEEGME